MRLGFCTAILLLEVSLPLAVQAQTAPGDGFEFFEKRIRPVLVEHCYECHSAGAKRQGGLQLDSREGIRLGGDSGPAVVPSSADQSLILDALRYGSFKMPPKGRLSKQVIDDFEKWIRIGAPDPRDGTVRPAEGSSAELLEKGRDFWAFQAVRRPVLPPDSDRNRGLGPLDRIVDAKLAGAGLSLSRAAAKDVLLRRVYFDLIGLPPTPEEIDAFIADDSPGAFETVVNRLLDAPGFGERWARHWLDTVRFAESSGGGRTRIFDHAWRYRDYVIDSFERDKPFNQFVVEQIAGDLLKSDSTEVGQAHLTATSLLAIGPINYELQDKELLDMEVIDEQLGVIFTAFQAMTIGCARCHDHKFDPIPTRDYYALAGILKSTKTLTHANVSDPVMRNLPGSEDEQRAIAAYAELMAPVEQRIAHVESELKALAPAASRGEPDNIPLAKLTGLVRDEADASLIGEWTASQSIRGYVGDGYHFSNDPDAEARYRIPLETAGRYEVRISYTPASNRAKKVPVLILHEQGETTRFVDMTTTVEDGPFETLGTFLFESYADIVVKGSDRSGCTIADCVQLVDAEAAVAGSKRSAAKPSADVAQAPSDQTERSNADGDLKRVAEARRKAELSRLNTELKTLKTTLADMQKRAPRTPVVMSVEEAAEPADCPLCIRGNVHNQGPAVPRGFLSIMTGGQSAEIPAGQSGRRQLAEWIASPDNTLTARVLANRVWYWLFGSGIVRTTDNFGTTGELPSNQKLLDWLAADFVEHDWSLKRLVRQIVLSQTYQQSSVASPEAAERDPENRLLSHANRRRLDAECIRDAVLLTSGQLDRSQGGSTIRPGSSTEFGYQLNDPKFDGNRRSVYVPVFRNTLLDLFTVFDFPDPNLPQGRRTTSTRPTQGLYLMNSPWMMDQSRATAQRLLGDQSLSNSQRVERAHRLLLGRPPTPAERGLAEAFLGDALAAERADNETPDRNQTRIQNWAEFCHTIYSSVDFRYVR